MDVVNLTNSYAFALIFELVAVRHVPYHRALATRLSLERRATGRCVIYATIPGLTTRHKPLRVRLDEVQSFERGARIAEAFGLLLRSPQLFDWLRERGFAVAPEDGPALELTRTRG